MKITYDVWVNDRKVARLELTTTGLEEHSLLSPHQAAIEESFADTGRVLSQQIAQLIPSEIRERQYV